MIKGISIISAFKAAEVRSIVALPDIVTCDALLWPLSADPAFKFVPVCKEDEGVSICAGLSYCNNRAVLMMQHTGFLDSINAIRAIAVDYQLPIVMVVGLQGAEAGVPAAQSRITGIRALIPISDALGLAYAELGKGEDELTVTQMIHTSYEKSSPCVVFIPQPPV